MTQSILSIILSIQLVFVLLFLLVWAVYYCIKKKTGDCELEWQDNELTINEDNGDNVKDTCNQEYKIKFFLPVKSIGKQQCILVDMTGRIHPEGERYNHLNSRVYVYPSQNRRNDGYWEAVLIKPGDTLTVIGEITLSGDSAFHISVKEALKKLGYLKIDLYYKYYCRNLIEYSRKTIRLNLAEIMEVEKDTDICYGQIPDDGQNVIPIKTRLLLPGDNLDFVFDKYVKPFVKEGDVLAVCESALAIMEGRAYYCEDIKPGFFALRLNKLFKMDSSLSSPYSMEMAIREAGILKIIFSVIMGALGRLLGRAGDFYLFAGRAVATIDDCTGTLPPFDKYVVMGPKDPKTTALNFFEKTGTKLAVVDVNDLGKVDVLALTDPSDKDKVVEALKTNPQGNANEQTPIALIRA